MTRRTLLLGIDIGTSGTKAVLYTPEGRAVAETSRAYAFDSPRPGWAEQDPTVWWEAVCACLQELADRPDVDPREIVSLGLTGQMQGLVLLDADGEPVCPAILWCDTRIARECAETEEIIGLETLLEITGNRALNNCTGPKYLWVRRHMPEAAARAVHLLVPKDYIRYRLTGRYAGEPTDASGTLLFDTGHFCWSEEVCRALGIDTSLLPPIVPSAGIAGTVTPGAAMATGLPSGLPVAGGAGDNAAAAVGVGAVNSGQAFTTIGTSGVIYTHTDHYTYERAGRVHTYCSPVAGEWAYLASIQSAGFALRWFRENCCGDLPEADAAGLDAFAYLDREAASVPPGSEQLFFLPYLMGERAPHFDPNARACFIGLSARHGRPEMTRAVMEGVSFAFADCLALCHEMGVRVDSMTLCGGGGKSALWRQMLADIFRFPIAEPMAREGASLGAVLLGGVGVGVYANVRTACAQVCASRSVLQPNPEDLYAPIYAIWRRLYPAMRDIFADMAAQ